MTVQDRLVALTMAACRRVFGEPAQIGAETLEGVFDSRWVEALDQQGAPVSMQATVFSYEPGATAVQPQVGQTITIRGRAYRIQDRHPDNLGATMLILEAL